MRVNPIKRSRVFFLIMRNISSFTLVQRTHTVVSRPNYHNAADEAIREQQESFPPL
jgi:hypothetical protein